uniref:Uncharacterized protein n=1 Tax=Macrostomum lignano TaxID=282301 RepID=A0A1I8IME0_9PLAT
MAYSYTYGTNPCGLYYSAPGPYVQCAASYASVPCVQAPAYTLAAPACAPAAAAAPCAIAAPACAPACAPTCAPACAPTVTCSQPCGKSCSSTEQKRTYLTTTKVCDQPAKTTCYYDTKSYKGGRPCY